jgi:hypothetical protein
MVFAYPPLLVGDGLRILTLLPGDFGDPLAGVLEPVLFSAKPRYLALSYTWSDPDPSQSNLPTSPPPNELAGENSQELNPGDLPTPDHTLDTVAAPSVILVNGRPLAIGHNLALALIFLRSPTQSLPLWIDAVCINQVDIPERNAQVALMAFIFTRAAVVVAWLGAGFSQYGDEMGGAHARYQAMRQAWTNGEARRLAVEVNKGTFSKLAPRNARNNTGVLAIPDSVFSSETNTIHTNLYWHRLWVVQEVCLPREIIFAQGGRLWSEQQVAAWLRTSATCSAAMRELIEARQGRFLEEMNRFEALVERFAEHGCAELRDRVFGVVGMASDIDAYPGDEDEEGGGSDADGSDMGRPRFLIDYKRSFYSIWRDIVRFMHFQAKPLDEIFGTELQHRLDERRIRLIRFAGLVQNAFEGRVEREVIKRLVPLSQLDEIEIPGAPPCVIAKGYVAGQILHIGPSYNSFVGFYREQKKWLGCWETYYPDSDQLFKLKQMEEEYSSRILDYETDELRRIQAIDSPNFVARSALWEPPSQPAVQLIPPYQPPNTSNNPVRFLGGDLCMGLAPDTARPGDLIIRFWDCDAAIVIRHVPEPSGKSRAPGGEEYLLVGRADVAEHVTPLRRVPGRDAPAMSAMGVRDAGGELTTRGMYVRMDFTTLEMITASITT